MSDSYQRVEPTPFDAPGERPVPAWAPSSTAGARRGWLLPACAGLGLVVLLVVFALPRWVARPGAGAPTPPAAEAGRNPPGAIPQSTAPSADTNAGNARGAASPFAEAVEAKARSEAQDLLAELLEVKENLDSRGAETWAAEAMAAVTAEASAGDTRYRERDFAAAIAHYRRALEQALALERSIAPRFAQALAAFDAAIEALDRDSAATALAGAGRLAPGDPALATREARLTALPALAAEVAAALAAQEAGDYPEAVARMAAAAGLDGEHRYVAAQLKRLRRALAEQRFNAAMSAGYAALNESDFEGARSRFNRAGKLIPDSAEVATALQELAVARTADRLKTLQRQAEAHVAGEDWTPAIAAFEAALAIDDSLRFAREGLALARPRAALHRELTAILEGPERLVDDAILREARASLERAKAAAAPGPKLRRQIGRVEGTLRVASTPLPVRLRSDGATEVSVYKVARLGFFEEQRLELRPGKYTAVGTRRGFRDVRVVFTVTPDHSAPVFIACSEAI